MSVDDVEPDEIDRLKAVFFQTGMARYKQKSIHADTDVDVIWGTDEYGCDVIASADPGDVDKAIAWVTSPCDPDHPAAPERW